MSPTKAVQRLLLSLVLLAVSVGANSAGAYEEEGGWSCKDYKCCQTSGGESWEEAEAAGRCIQFGNRCEIADRSYDSYYIGVHLHSCCNLQEDGRATTWMDGDRERTEKDACADDEGGGGTSNI